jgi:hypothetical protein
MMDTASHMKIRECRYFLLYTHLFVRSSLGGKLASSFIFERFLSLVPLKTKGRLTPILVVQFLPLEEFNYECKREKGL